LHPAARPRQNAPNNQGGAEMIEQDVIVTTKHGRMPSFAACRDGPGPFPLIIFYMDAPGAEIRARAH